MTKRMLIDATHAEETRVVVLDGNRLDDFDVETSAKKQLKGNIYLAKVVRVEPSLQAAFVEYGGNRHGFLAFSEIHPDYYQIPVADRQRLLAMQAEEAREQEEAEDAAATRALSDPWPGADGAPEAPLVAEATPIGSFTAGSETLDESGAPLPEPAENAAPDAPPAGGAERSEEPGAAHPDPSGPAAPVPTGGSETLDESGAPLPEPAADAASASPAAAPGLPEPPDATPAPDQVAVAEPVVTDMEVAPEQAAELFPPRTSAAETGEADPEDGVETVPADAPPPETLGGEADAVEDARERRIPSRFLRNYKIQEVIRRRQILLVQVVKEERGTKGAALTTYISLAGRFCVLMPNSPRGGGISRKITSAADRRRLKEITTELDIPEGMGLIVRTAGANRPKPEIRRDCEYLLRLWDEIRETTLGSVAPALIYEEASLIKRAIRDGYSRDIDEVLVDGEEGWRAAHEYMRMLMPGHQQKVQSWRESKTAEGQPLFARYQVEAQLDAMLTPNVQLRSGGYLVINQTEALVAIDVNSGRSTRERNVEETALRTNLEAADEAARQLRLRDLAGLVVIDFIDMESRKHNAMVERRLKDALKGDRARIQVGHISHFGLLEMSRQRLRPSLAETSFVTCPHCGGTGHVRNTESAAIHALRGIEEEAAKRRAAEVMVHVAGPIAMYILNHKRDRLLAIESRYGLRVLFTADPTLIAPQMRLERLRAPVPIEAPEPEAAPKQETEPEQVEGKVRPDEAPESPPELLPEASREAPREAQAEPGAEPRADSGAEDQGEEGEQRRRRRRRRRGRREDAAAAPADTLPAVAQPGAEQPDSEVPAPVQVSPDQEPPATEEGGEEEQRGRHRGRRGGRRRRREAPPAGPTPADPFAGQVFEVFDAIEQAEQPPVPLPALPLPLPEAPPAVASAEPAAPDLIAPQAAAPEPAAPELVASELVAPTQSELVLATPNGAVPALPDQTESDPASPEPEPEPAIKPVLIDSGAPAVERKRGWWRR